MPEEKYPPLRKVFLFFSFFLYQNMIELLVVKT
jgi:hypothetical protein